MFYGHGSQKLQTASETELSALFTVVAYGRPWVRGSTSLLTSKLKALGLQSSPGSSISDKVTLVLELRLLFQGQNMTLGYVVFPYAVHVTGVQRDVIKNEQQFGTLVIIIW